MSDIKRQSILSSLYSYVGIILAAINTLILFPAALTTDQFGLISWILMIASGVSMFARLGVPQITIKYFPYFRTENKEHNGFLSMALLVPFIGAIIASVLLFLFQDFLVSFYAKPESQALISNFYFLLFPVLIFDIFFNILNAYTTSLNKASVIIFFRDLFVRLCITVLLLLCWKGVFDYQTFLYLYCSVYGLQSIGVLLYLFRAGQLKFNFNFSIFKVHGFDMMKYGAFALLSGGAAFITNYIDKMMVSVMDANELGALAIFTVFSYLGIVIMVPSKSIVQVTLPTVATAWKDNNLKAIDNIYKKTAITQLVIGLGLFIIVMANLDNFIELLATVKGNDSYAAGKYVALFIGLAKLIDGATGVNGTIILTSDYYRYDLLFTILLIGLSVVTNFYLISNFGLTGAAVATCIVAAVYNAIKFFFLKYKFDLQPFSINTVKTIVLGLAVLAINYILPDLNIHFIFDVIYRSAILGLIYGGLVFYLDLSPDITKLIKQILRKSKFIK